MSKGKKDPLKEEIDGLLRKMGFKDTEFSITTNCYLCKNNIGPPGILEVNHICPKKFVKAGLTPCKHRGSEFFSPVEGLSIGVHRCITCGFAWICKCNDCTVGMLQFGEMVENDFKGSPVQPSRIRCSCGSDSHRTLVECPMQMEDGPPKWTKGCEVEYPHFHVKCHDCKKVEMLEPGEEEPHRLRPGEARHFKIL